MDDSHPIFVTLAGKRARLTYDNTMMFFFSGDTTLDHVNIKMGEAQYYIYDVDLLKTLIDWNFPMYCRGDRPEWAIERFMARQKDDLDQLLFQGGESSG